MVTHYKGPSGLKQSRRVHIVNDSIVVDGMDVKYGVYGLK